MVPEQGYTIINSTVTVTHHISYNITILTLIPPYSSVEIKLLKVNYIKSNVTPKQAYVALRGPGG
jgi:hypothetical protein